MHKSKIKEVPPESRTACKIDHFVCFCYCRPALTFYEKAIMKNYVKDEAIIITGGTSAFGLETARMPLETGAMVTTAGRNEKRPAKAREDLASDRLLAVRGNAVCTDDWLDGYPSAGDFARSLVHCIDAPEGSFVDELIFWGTKQVREIINPF